MHGYRYEKMLCKYLVHELRRRRITLRNTFFQLDLATPHTSGIAQKFLETKFCERLISKGIWPARSPDIAPPDFYLFGYLKGKVYKDAPQDLEELENRIRYHLSRIPQATMTAVFQNLIKRITACTTPTLVSNILLLKKIFFSRFTIKFATI